MIKALIEDALTAEEEADLPEVRAAQRECKNMCARAALKKRNTVVAAIRYYQSRTSYVRGERDKKINEARKYYVAAQKEAGYKRDEEIRIAEKEYGETRQGAREARDNIINTAVGIRVISIPKNEDTEGE